jgi:hypothetical protein
MEVVTEEGGNSQLCRATPRGFPHLPPSCPLTPAQTPFSIFVAPVPGPGRTVDLGVPIGPVPGVL